MYKLYCDICGEPIETRKGWNRWNKYKVKKYVKNWSDGRWQNLEVHEECWKEMCEYIGNRTCSVHNISIDKSKNGCAMTKQQAINRIYNMPIITGNSEEDIEEREFQSICLQCIKHCLDEENNRCIVIPRD